MADDLLSKIHQLCRDIPATHDDLALHAELAASLVGAETCSVMLINGEGENARMSIAASHGPLAQDAAATLVARGEGLAGHVLASGEPLLVDDILASPYAALARRPTAPGRSLMLAPVRIEGRVVGTLTASCGGTHGCFCEQDLALLETVALFVGRAVQLRQLRGILASRFTQLALSRELQGAAATTAYQKPDHVARLLARSFYREMARAGFDSNQIVQAASEIIAQLNSNLARHHAREGRR
ncbi:GAF domain-containing protein [Pseudoduganella lutea]|uniref:GAF domain-containing protein n=1 Tax=Pseudoduganella lutea TaxID=321985 RepID=A0A4V0Z3I9_9BURK|nr:GAF domain-containing protein [Pseudoduganella lutea]QBE63603.1 GAF domain-containing protein [Pseudoduganella lutea]